MIYVITIKYSLIYLFKKGIAKRVLLIPFYNIYYIYIICH